MSAEQDTMCMKPGHVGWNELVTTNSKAAAEFYGKLFGWQATPFVPKGAPTGGPPYSIFKMNMADEMGLGGMMQTPQPGMPSQWLPYVMVEDVDDSLKKATKLGAKVCVPVMSIGEVGRIAVIQDPQGATIGLHESPKG
jgi:predicted enzyme related to lactoylglutathione lyase